MPIGRKELRTMKEKIAFLTEIVGRAADRGEGLELSPDATQGFYQILSEVNDGLCAEAVSRQS